MSKQSNRWHLISTTAGGIQTFGFGRPSPRSGTPDHGDGRQWRITYAPGGMARLTVTGVGRRAPIVHNSVHKSVAAAKRAAKDVIFDELSEKAAELFAMLCQLTTGFPLAACDIRLLSELVALDLVTVGSETTDRGNRAVVKAVR